MISIDEAIKKVLDETETLEPEEMAVTKASGYVLAENVESDIDVPSFDKATMDGYALKAEFSGTDVELPVDGIIAAGSSVDDSIPDGHAVKIMTGAPVPSGCDAVIQVEETSEPKPGTVKLKSQIIKGKNIAFKGEEINKGDLIFPVGTFITPSVSAVLAQVGKTKVNVFRHPYILVLITGTELVDPDQVPQGGQIRESNSYGILAQCAVWGGVGLRVGSVLDKPEDIEKEIRAIFKMSPDILIITGGVSVGDFDLVPDIVSKSDARIIFHKVAQKPAKPMLFAKHGKTNIFGLPGNPVAAYLGFELYVGPSIRHMSGDKNCQTQYFKGIASGDFKVSSDREYFHPANVTLKDNKWHAEPVLTRGSADIYAVSRANAFARFKAGRYTISRGDEISFFFLKGRSHGT